MIIAPRSISELAELLRQQSTPVHISDHPSAKTGDILSTEHLNSVLFYEPEEMVIAVESGMSIKAVDELLASKGQWIPTLVADENTDRSIGAAIARDIYHPRAFSSGALRTSILGGTFVTTDGEIFRSGSRVVKSVAGYDIHRSFCGSQGRFGVIASVILKVQPRPEAFFRFSTSSTTGLDLLSPTICELLDNRYLVECAGNIEDIEQDKAALRSSEIAGLNHLEWADSIKQIRAEKQRKMADYAVEQVLADVRKVFDPKQLLV